MYIKAGEHIYRIIVQDDNGAWLIDTMPDYKFSYVDADMLSTYDKIPEPKFIQENRLRFCNYALTQAQQKRLQIIKPLLDEENVSLDKKELHNRCIEIANEHGTTALRVEKLYRKFKATYSLANSARQNNTKTKSDIHSANFMWAIRTIYFSIHRVSLQDAYNIMLLKKYTIDGKLVDEIPSFWSFRKFYYSHALHKKSSRSISRHGLKMFLQNERVLYGSAMKWRDRIGSYQMDSTIADIFLVSRFNRKQVVGRPMIYLAVDTLTQMIAGVYVGFENGCAGTLACLSNVVYDKVTYCKQYSIEIEKWQWPSAELPGEIITDKGSEFLGKDVQELCTHFGIVCHSMPPFRPDRKGLVEMSFDMLQRRYKSILRGNGVVEYDYEERWAPDYRGQAILNIDEFTKIIIRCILYLNTSRILGNQFITKEIAENDIPLNAASLWLWYKHNHQSNLIQIDKDDFYKFTLSRTKRTVQRRGIQMNSLWYNSPDIVSAGIYIGDRVDVAFDENDITYIFIVVQKEFIKVPLADTERQFAGLTPQEFHAIVNNQATSAKKQKKYEVDARMKMLSDIDSIVKRAKNDNK